MGVGGGLIRAFLRQGTLHRIAVLPVGFIGVGITDLHMGFIERNVYRHTQETPYAPLADERIVF